MANLHLLMDSGSICLGGAYHADLFGLLHCTAGGPFCSHMHHVHVLACCAMYGIINARECIRMYTHFARCTYQFANTLVITLQLDHKAMLEFDCDCTSLVVADRTTGSMPLLIISSAFLCLLFISEDLCHLSFVQLLKLFKFFVSCNFENSTE